MLLAGGIQIERSARSFLTNLLSTANAGTTVMAARGKSTPERSKISRVAPVAFAKRQRTEADDENGPHDGDASGNADDVSDDKPQPEATPKPPVAAQADVAALALEHGDHAAPYRGRKAARDSGRAGGDAADHARRRRASHAHAGTPRYPRRQPRRFGLRRTGRVPRGDSRSMRQGDAFALVYRVGTYVISRFGTVGTRGQWRVVEYPTSTRASYAYAQECSRFVSEGFPCRLS